MRPPTPAALLHKLSDLRSLQRLRSIVTAVRGAELFLVGGAVRDLLLKRPLGDLDVIVRGIPLRHLQALLAKYGKVNFVGKTFGILKFTPHSTTVEIDVALPRTEHAFGTGGTRDVDVRYDPQLPLRQDLRRRDFTVNALALNLATGAIVDPGQGLSDLAGERLRAVGSPRLRFQEDLSRVLRGLRFAVELGFQFDSVTWRELKRVVPRLADETVPRELVAREFLKAFAADPLKTIDLWDVSGAFRATMPEVLAMKGCPQPRQFHTEGDVWTHARLSVEAALSQALPQTFGSPPTLETLLAIFLHDVGKPQTLRTPRQHGTNRIRTDGHDVASAQIARQLVERLRFSSCGGLVSPDRIDWLIRNHMIALSAKNMRPSTLERYFLRDRVIGDELLKLIWADGSATIGTNGRPTQTALTVLRRRLKTISPRPKIPRPLVRGDELMRIFGLPSGPIVGKLIDYIRDRQLEGRVTTRKAAFLVVKRYLAKR